jgi:hypothetical protein
MAGRLPAWLEAAVDQRLALIDKHLRVTPAPLIITPLAEPPENSTALQRARWERSCDCCGKYCPYPREDFYTGHVQRTAKSGALVIITLGVCKDHRYG